ncbi:hypothetical protein LD125_00627 [Mesoplasma sp. JKS002658]|uniref:hypothetical protein n=1 Tax=Mesoplasma whartonense TaxID=2878854 RepID=UPI002022B672|nr:MULTISPECIES: hypothetical protein [unclassified Mesoplasma]MCL8211653.1 hypothetical protein [Mesoplasma sp. JKS002664]MCL8212392.1 hypothetical protein [Mesoplasma sp. JKS002662]MCL8212768.1 hypothetical protein [Mesoplasma sp. JKS002661]MCL8213539.1 hypothetical protein [Mesoplasma sp. JKS002660]MCL8214363.1 hypothetical protein [Mesoplasma sp. JKS002658]
MEMNTYCAKCKNKGPVVDVKVGNEDNPVQVSMQLCYGCFEESFNKDADDSVYYLDDYEDDEADDLDDEFDNTFESD